MSRKLNRRVLGHLFIASLALGLCACVSSAVAPASLPDRVTMWPARAATPVDAILEARVAEIVSGMTLEQKVGQMTQPDIRSVTPADVRTYYIGSILNGGGAWPEMRRRATPQEWAALSNAYYEASMASDMAVPVPVIWGTDAVHGHNNVFGATLYPHNIGLGAAHDPDLVARIARATARATRATGISWSFAPTLAVVQDQRWGRTYESYSSDPALVRAYAESFVRAMQGELNGPDDVIATAKHFLGDGGTAGGVDQGDTRVELSELISTHAQGYYGALDGDVQTVMVSYSSWNEQGVGERGVRMHANRYLITEVLKGRLGFDGIVVSDWNAIEQVPGCTRTRCAEAINAGIDLVMVPEDWRGFIRDTVEDVRQGRIPMSRIDDAVSRIVRVKLRAGLFEVNPADTAAAMPATAIADRELAREAVRRSLVLLKNDDRALPLASNSRVLVVGRGADSMARQSGGWSRTWQGDDNPNEAFGTGETLVQALTRALGAANVVYSETAEGVDVRGFDAVIAVLAEEPYAEGRGDITWPRTLSHAERYPEDLRVLRSVAEAGVPVVTIFYSGRTLYANDLINASDAFVAAWLPGSEAQGIVDLLVAGANGRPAYEFTGRLPFAWPGDPCDSVGRAAEFPVGYGLTYARPRRIGALRETADAATCEQ